MITVAYDVDAVSIPNDHATITYTDPTSGMEFSIAAATNPWIEAWQIPASKPVFLEVKVAGPFVVTDSCGIYVNSQRVTGQGGQAAANGTLDCNYQLLGSSAP
jgi:hypothetical protein